MTPLPPPTATTPSTMTQSPTLNGCAAHGVDAKWKRRRRKLRVKMENTIFLPPLPPPNPSEDLSLLPPRCANPRIANQNTKRWQELAAHSQPAKKKEFENKWIGEWRKKNRLSREKEVVLLLVHTSRRSCNLGCCNGATQQHSWALRGQGPFT